MTSTFTTNRGYRKQGTGDNPNTWGTLLNTDVFDIIDKNLGSTLSISVAGSSNVTLSASQAQNMIHRLTGVLTGNINYIFPAAGGFFFISNETTGSFTITVKPLGGTGISIPQGSVVAIYIDGVALTANGAIGTASVFTSVLVSGTANALVVAQTLPANYALTNGNFISIFPVAANSGAATVNIAGTGAIAIKKVTPSGLVDLDAGDFATGIPVLLLYNGSVYIAITSLYLGKVVSASAGFSLAFTDLFKIFVSTTAITVTLPATTVLPSYFYSDLNALGGDITLAPNGTDTINGVNANFIVPQGSSCRILTNGAGAWYTDYLPNTTTGNGIINGGFTIGQRGTTLALATSVAYGLDRWGAQGGAAAGIFNQDTSITAGLGFKNNAKVGRNNGSSSTVLILIAQALESINSIPFAGQRVTFSFWAKKGANFSSASNLLTVLLSTGTGTDQSLQNSINGAWTGQAQTINTTDTLTTSWQRFQHTVLIPTSTTQIGISFNYTPVGTAGADDNFYITGVQLEIANAATAYKHRSFAEELLLCQRYYEKSFALATTPAQNVGATDVFWLPQVVAASTLMYPALIPFKVLKRSDAPTCVIYNPSAANAEARNFQTASDCSGTIINDNQANGLQLRFTTPGGSAAGNEIGIHWTASAEL